MSPPRLSAKDRNDIGELDTVTAYDLRSEMVSRGVLLTVMGNSLNVKAPQGELASHDIERLRKHKAELMVLLATDTLDRLIIDPAAMLW